MISLPFATNVNVPISQVGIIAGVLGVLFILVALYKSLTHKRKPPEEVAMEAMEAQRKKDAEDALRVKIADPYAEPAAPPVKEPAPAPIAPSQPDEQPSDQVYKNVKKMPVGSAFRQLKAGGAIDKVDVTQKDEYQWE